MKLNSKKLRKALRASTMAGYASKIDQLSQVRQMPRIAHTCNFTRVFRQRGTCQRYGCDSCPNVDPCWYRYRAAVPQPSPAKKAITDTFASSDWTVTEERHDIDGTRVIDKATLINVGIPTAALIDSMKQDDVEDDNATIPYNDSFTEDGLKLKTVDNLHQICNRLDIAYKAKDRKADLVAVILAKTKWEAK